jgi:tryptophanyl-tRNA synthetase
MQFSHFKNELNELAVESLGPITKEMRKLLEDQKYLESLLIDGGDRANTLAKTIIDKTKNIVGYF